MVDGSEVLHVLGVGIDDKSYIACRDGDCTGCTLRLTFFGPKRAVLESGAPPSSKQLKRAVCGRLSGRRCLSSFAQNVITNVVMCAEQNDCRCPLSWVPRRPTAGCETVRQPWSERTESCECPQFARRERSDCFFLRNDGALEGAGGALVRPRAHAW